MSILIRTGQFAKRGVYNDGYTALARGHYPRGYLLPVWPPLAQEALEFPRDHVP